MRSVGSFDKGKQQLVIGIHDKRRRNLDVRGVACKKKEKKSEEHRVKGMDG